jgi:hypothetical protein
VFAAAAVLPSSLVLPQTNPTRTLEYAPVPPAGVDAAPPGGSLATLGLGTTTSLTQRASVPTPTPHSVAGVVGKNPSTKRCVGSPPRQTEDPSSPPCVAFFQGDNGGATYRGVSRTEVTVIFHFQGGTVYGPTGRGTEDVGEELYYDVDAPPRDDDPPHVRGLRVLQRYFNSRYQTYGRFVHLWAYYDKGVPDPREFRASAADNDARVHPFASIIYSPGYEDEYLEEMARRGVLNFGSRRARSASFYRKYPSLVWGYLPSVEYEAHEFSEYVCRKVVRFPAAFSGNAGENGRARRLGLIRSADPTKPGPQLYARLVRQAVEACGGTFVAVADVPQSDGFYIGQTPDYAYTNMAEFKQKGVSTVIWAQGAETSHSAAAAQLDYHPEWILGGNRIFEGADWGHLQDQNEWSRAWVVSSVAAVPRLEESLCFTAVRETDPTLPRGDAAFICNGTGAYDDLRQLFTGIQVAGPRLTPASMDKGFHAIPAVASRDARVAACFYDPDDYTCVKDAVQMWWDRQGQSPNTTTPGCWRMTEGGRRYLRGAWPDGNVGTQKGPGDACNGYVASNLFSA